MKGRAQSTKYRLVHRLNAICLFVFSKEEVNLTALQQLKVTGYVHKMCGENIILDAELEILPTYCFVIDSLTGKRKSSLMFLVAQSTAIPIWALILLKEPWVENEFD